MRNLILFLLLSILPVTVGFTQVQQCITAEPLKKGELNNLYSVSSKLYRSEQPVTDDWNVLKNEGVTTVINLRRKDTDSRTVKDNSIHYVHLPMKASNIDYNKVVECLRLINESKGACLIHCLHGSDRTGCIIACSRLVFCDWSRQEAINEFLDEKFGYHKFWFPGIKKFLEEVNVEKLKKDVLSDKT